MKPRNFPDHKRLRQATAMEGMIRRGEPTDGKTVVIEDLNGNVTPIRTILKETRIEKYYQELTTLDALVAQGSRREQRSKINRSSTSFGRVR